MTKEDEIAAEIYHLEFRTHLTNVTNLQQQLDSAKRKLNESRKNFHKIFGISAEAYGKQRNKRIRQAMENKN